MTLLWGLNAMNKKPVTDAEAARYVVQTHPLAPCEGESHVSFVLRIVHAYDNAKAALAATDGN